jgi:uncharacterized protein YndB with AHSA1/START domain
MKQELIEHIGAVRREVRDCERDGRPARAVVAERTYDTTPEDVWDAITNGERIPRWFLPVEGDLRLGGRYQLEGNAGGEITACDPPAHLALTWEFGDGVTWVDVHLSDDPGGGTRLRLEHAAALDDLDHWEEFGPGAVGIGWELTLLGLAEHLRTGEPVSAESEIVAGPAGAAFTARSSDAWCEADVAAGTPEAVARARADRTTAAYTGEAPPDA